MPLRSGTGTAFWTSTTPDLRRCVALRARSSGAMKPPSRRFARLGEELHAGMWRNIAGTYHAGLRNVCGLFSRAYAMDMSSYAARWARIWSVVGEEHAPFPDLAQHFDHVGDVCFGTHLSTCSRPMCRVPPAARSSPSAAERTVHAGGSWMRGGDVVARPRRHARWMEGGACARRRPTDPPSDRALGREGGSASSVTAESTRPLAREGSTSRLRHPGPHG